MPERPDEAQREARAHRARPLQQPWQQVAAPTPSPPPATLNRSTQRKTTGGDKERAAPRASPARLPARRRSTAPRKPPPQPSRQTRRPQTPGPALCQRVEASEQVTQRDPSGGTRKDQRGKRGAEGARDPQDRRVTAGQDRQTPGAPMTRRRSAGRRPRPVSPALPLSAAHRRTRPRGHGSAPGKLIPVTSARKKGEIRIGPEHVAGPRRGTGRR